MNPALLSALAAALYLAAAVDEWRKVNADDQRRSMTFTALFGLGLLMHWGAAATAIGIGQASWSLSLGTVTSLTTSLIALSILILRWRQPLYLILTPLIGLVALVTGVSLLGSSGGRVVTSSAGIGAHIILSLAAFAVLFIGGFQALLLAVQNHALKTRRLAHLPLLPPITRMERLLFDLIWLGWALLTVSLLSGWWFLEDLFAQHLAHKTALSLIAWTIFGALLVGRGRYGWRGFTASAWTLAGFGVLLLGTLGSKIILEIVLERV